MKRFVPLLGVICVVALTLLSGVIQGRMSNRWGPLRDALAAAEKLQEIPSRFGNWKLESTDKLPESVADMLECTGYIFRTYVNQETGATVRMSLLFGPSGPMSVHTPEICYSSRDYTIHEERRRTPIQVGGSNENFWVLTLQSTGIEGDMLHVYYAWSTGDHWQAPEDPRFKFASSPFLYKIQLAGSLPLMADPEADDNCRRFLEEFVPAARPYLVGTDDD